MKVLVEYDVIYSYDNVVTVNDNVLRVFPSTEFWQKPLDTKITIEPTGKIIHYTDRFGNKNARIKMTDSHYISSFKVISTIETTPYKVTINDDLNLPLEKSSIPSDIGIYLNASTLINPELIRHRAPEILEHVKTLKEALIVLTEWVTRNIEYTPTIYNY
ncbi:MAG: hypothetical protein HC944_03615 [Nanoarchaeota archaeon]|nr:hypothetical protein [Nanoarchaeota archaeon]